MIDRLKSMFRKEQIPQRTDNPLDLAQRYRERLSPAELAVVVGYAVSIRTHKEQLGNVDLLLLGVGSYAGQIYGERVTPHDLDLKLVTSAPSGSELQERAVRAAEAVTQGYLDLNGLPYTQMVGFNWHLVTEHSVSGAELVLFQDYDPQNPRFKVNAAEGRRAIDFMIAGFGQPSIEDHLAKESERRPFVVLMDTRIGFPGLL